MNLPAMSSDWKNDRRSASARGYDWAWQKRRAAQLREEPLCRMCDQDGRVTAATVADHITPHRGDPVLFKGPLQSLCKHCHDSRKQLFERTGVIAGGDISGRPADPRHHWNT